jgi:hypothetical protein
VVPSLVGHTPISWCDLEPPHEAEKEAGERALEFDARRWEGDSNVTGTVNGQAVTGVAYVEELPPKQLPTRGSAWATIFQSLLGTL